MERDDGKMKAEDLFFKVGEHDVRDSGEFGEVSEMIANEGDPITECGDYTMIDRCSSHHASLTGLTRVLDHTIVLLEVA